MGFIGLCNTCTTKSLFAAYIFYENGVRVTVLTVQSYEIYIYNNIWLYEFENEHRMCMIYEAQ